MNIDLISIFDQFGIEYRTNVPGWVNVECPICLHSGDRGFKGGFNLNDGHFNCWVCGGHNKEYVLKKLLNVDSNTLDDLLKQYSTTMRLFNQRNKKKAQALEVELPGGPFEHMHTKYLLNRGFDPDFLARKYKLQGTGMFGEYSYRIIIPIIYHGQVVSFQGRSIFSKKKCKELDILRYKTCPIEKSIIDPKTILYNLDNCYRSGVVIVEGPFDAMRLGDDVCATLGTTMEDAQLHLLASRFKKAIFLFDPEPEATKRAIDQGSRLSVLGVDVQIMDTGYSNDPGSFTEEQVRKVKKMVGI